MTVKLKTNGNYSVHEGGFFFLNSWLFMLKFDSLSKFLAETQLAETQTSFDWNKKIRFNGCWPFGYTEAAIPFWGGSSGPFWLSTFSNLFLVDNL